MFCLLYYFVNRLRWSATHWAKVVAGRRVIFSTSRVTSAGLERVGEHGCVGVGEFGAETQTDETLPHDIRRHLEVAQRATQDPADDRHQFGIGERLRPVSGICCPTSSSVSNACAATAAMSVST